MKFLALIGIVLLTSPGPTDAQVPVRQVSGVVVDESGAPVPGASVRLLVAGTRPSEVHTGPDGRFTLEDVPPGDVILKVRAAGFAETARLVAQQGAASTVRVVLGPAALSESITVTASRGADALATPAATSVLTSADLLNAAAGALDDALRATPGFSLFRRSSSRTANPTTQGVTLRGLAASGASRTLVLADGVPLNDPFGSWVYWNRVPQAAIDRVEVVRGASGDLYGPDALGGVIQVLTFEPRRARVRVVGDVASRGTGRISAFAGGGRGAWSGSVTGDWLETDGAYIVARADRGIVDVPAESDSRSTFLTLRFDRGALGTVLRAGLSSERRGNGTPLQKNATDWRQLAGEITGTLAGGAWIARASGGTQRYDQTFSAVTSDRSSERLTSEQRIPSAFASSSGQWVRSWGPRVLLVGAEARRVASDVNQTTYAFSGTPSTLAPFGGTETGFAAFGRLRLLLADRGFLTVGARGERWTSDPIRVDDPRHAKGFFSPRVAFGWQLHPQLSAQASAWATS